MKSIERFSALVPPTQSLLRPMRKHERSEIVEAWASSLRKQSVPFNAEMYLLDDFAEIIAKKEVGLSLEVYWEKGIWYDPVDIYVASVEFFDCYEGPLPKTALPPEGDVRKFIDKVLASDRKLTVAEQFEILLEISKGSILGAANLGMMGDRLMARGWDRRAYPGIKITPEIIREAINHLAPFEGGKDALGDNYYFWTHFFATATYRQLEGPLPKALDKFFGVGTPIMRFVRRHIVHQPTMSDNQEASGLGRLTGMVMSDYLEEIRQQIVQQASL